MNRSLRFAAGFSILAALLSAAPSRGQTQEAATVETAIRVVDEIMAIPANRIPQSLLASAEGLAIVPNVVKGGFVVGIRWGKGIVVVRDETRAWRPPVFVNLTGGSLGWQAGIQATDVILVFRTRKSVDGLLRGKFTIGADASVAAGPVGREASAATDSKLGAEILSYSRSRGLFAGVALDGSALQIDQAANQNYYLGTGYSPNGVPPGQPVQLPPSTLRLVEQLTRYAGGTGTATTVAGQPMAPVSATPVTSTPGPPASPAASLLPPGLVPNAAQAMSGQAEAVVRQQLGSAYQRLQGLLDENWKQYLALPAGLLTGGPPPTIEAVTESVNRFDTVARDPRYGALAQRPEFRLAQELLKKYLSIRQGAPTSGLTLPPPPAQATRPPTANARY